MSGNKGAKIGAGKGTKGAATGAGGRGGEVPASRNSAPSAHSADKPNLRNGKTGDASKPASGTRSGGRVGAGNR